MDNIEIANILNQIADILELKGGNKFKIGAYRHAAQIIEAMPKDINEIYKKDELEKIPGVGKSIADHIRELIETGKCKKFEKIKKYVPKSVVDLINIQGLGPKKVKFLYKKFNVKSIADLEKLVKSHRLLRFKGWGKKSEQNILKGIKLYHKFSKRFLLGRIYFLAQGILKKLKAHRDVDKAEVCGSIRRMKETIGDLDFLVTTRKPRENLINSIWKKFLKELELIRE